MPRKTLAARVDGHVAHALGDIVRLVGPTDATEAFVDAPSGLQLRIPTAAGAVDLWLAQVGTWRIAWPGGDVRVLEVEPRPPKAAAALTLVDAPTAYLHLGIPNQYVVGDRASLRFAFTNRQLSPSEQQVFAATGELPDGAGVAPDIVECTVRPPGAPATPVYVSTIATGVFIAEVDLDQKGEWWYAVDGKGGFPAAAERALTVKPQRVPRP